MEKYNGATVLWSNRRDHNGEITLEEYVKDIEVLRIVYGDGNIAPKITRSNGRVNARVLDLRCYRTRGGRYK